MSASNSFDKKEMTEWENKSEIIKNDFNKAKLNFKGLVKDYETYKQNSGSIMGKSKYKSVNQAKEAKQGDKLREYITKIATAAVARKEQQDKRQCQNKGDQGHGQPNQEPHQSCRPPHQITCKQREQAQQQAHWRGPPSKAVHQAMKHGLLLLVARIPPGRRESHERSMQVEKRGP